jgi:histidine kinase
MLALRDVFLPFFSTKHATGRNTGLGLSICYGIVTKYRDTIAAANRKNGGCRFTVKLPVVK